MSIVTDAWCKADSLTDRGQISLADLRTPMNSVNPVNVGLEGW